MQSNPDLVQQMGRSAQQFLIEVQRMEKRADLMVRAQLSNFDIFIYADSNFAWHFIRHRNLEITCKVRIRCDKNVGFMSKSGLSAEI